MNGKGEILTNTAVYINDQKYITDSKGKIYIEKKPTTSMKVQIEIDGKKVDAEVLGENIKLKSSDCPNCAITHFPSPWNYSSIISWWSLLIIMFILIGTHLKFRTFKHISKLKAFIKKKKS